MAAADVPDALRLMRKLAIFERYIDAFRVTETALADHAFMDDPPFHVFVCGPEGGPLLGYAVTYWVRWTYTLAPTLVLKELFVDESARGTGAGTTLFRRVRQQAEAGGAGKIEWLVLHENTAAKSFYRNQGARQDAGWEPWVIKLQDHGAR
jgi:GNAT superfamily N-acetyltransferase